jgi:hypothetical protein
MIVLMVNMRSLTPGEIALPEQLEKAPEAFELTMAKLIKAISLSCYRLV